ncbi:hypothetical protein SmJEL517_g01146 [Synchytrium microbalum]|uniref:Glycosyltransferase 2-like domain-containing protein n=1 Tax=Synchytrium microbalum TaxID=1806994 RepID=A0A507CAV5_9FUNG|nr:uncharacterized protein SmJEL517_g01146 [Synchytrium microbalum]TPX36752.1 hypothetical protein SmJEL517_g01146 [Synchytrium microbalum]
MFYLTPNTVSVFIPFGFIGIYRWFWFMIKLLAWSLYKPWKPIANPKYTSRDVTILVPTIDSGEEIKLAVRSWLKNDPFQIIFITTNKAKQGLEDLANEVDPKRERIRVVCIEKPNKRNQMVAGINHTKTDIIVFCDDDVMWPETMLQYMLAPFEDPKMGGVGTTQRVVPVGKHMTVWEVLSAYRIAMRNIEVTSSTYIDGGVCCLSGRTAAYRTSILRDHDFQWQFTHEYWYRWYFGKWIPCHQHSGDDKFLTRWIVSHDWNTHIQACKQAELASTFKNNWRFLKQIMRWTRNTWRSDIKSLFMERKIWNRYPFVAYQMIDKFFNPLTLLYGPATVIYMCIDQSKDVNARLSPWVIILSYVIWLLLTRLVKYMPHFVKRPQDILYLPVWLIFNYAFAIMKVYCLFSLHNTDWGTRQGADHTTDKEDLTIFEAKWKNDVLNVVDYASPTRVSAMKSPTADSVHPRHSATIKAGTPIKKTGFLQDNVRNGSNESLDSAFIVTPTLTNVTSPQLMSAGSNLPSPEMDLSMVAGLNHHHTGNTGDMSNADVRRFKSMQPVKHFSFVEDQKLQLSDEASNIHRSVTVSMSAPRPQPSSSMPAHSAMGRSNTMAPSSAANPTILGRSSTLSRTLATLQRTLTVERQPERNTFKNWD